MNPKRIGVLCAAIGLSLGLGACADDYGYGGVAVGYGDYYGDPYGYADPYGYGYGQSNFGWYGDYYYPGTGIYVYDSYRRPYRWNGQEQRYWRGRQQYRGRDWNGQGSWNGFDRRGPGNWQNGDGGRRWQRQPAHQGRPDGGPYRGDRNGYTPGAQGYRGTPGDRGDGQGYRPGPRGDAGVRFGTPRYSVPRADWSGRGGGGSRGGSAMPNGRARSD